MHPQDRLLVVEALVQFAGPGDDLGVRKRWAWVLAEALVAEEGLALDEFPAQIDAEWAGPKQ